MIGGTPAAVVELVCGPELQVAFVGFAPGFPYLVGLPPELAAVPRRTTPRVSVPAGSVAVAGGFASVYPRRHPGRVAAARSHHDPAVRPRPSPVRAPAARATPSASHPLRRTPTERRPDGTDLETGTRPRPPLAARTAPLRRGPRPRAAEPGRGRRPATGGRPGHPPGRTGRPRHHATGQPPGGQPRRDRGHRGHRRRADAPVHRPRPPRRGGPVGPTVRRSSSTGTRWPPGSSSPSRTARWSPSAGSGAGCGPTWRCPEGFETPLVVGSRSTDLLSGTGTGAAHGRRPARPGRSRPDPTGIWCPRSRSADGPPDRCPSGSSRDPTALPPGGTPASPPDPGRSARRPTGSASAWPRPDRLRRPGRGPDPVHRHGHRGHPAPSGREPDHPAARPRHRRRVPGHRLRHRRRPPPGRSARAR